ncbi:MAG TPA: NAD(P)-dependent oxidoreductase [Lacunisphaera sp.]|jgi:3-hydroxyisobutyrate dehydrogenase|nr:NAD(P)-dependent oxidoreductase [Lacunisphaera sp.]
MATSPTRVAVLGLGLMGGGMARRLLAAGFPVSVFNRSRAKADALAAVGAKVAATPREAAAGANVILSMVADDTAARTVWLGPDGALAAAPRGAIAIDSSTVTPGWIRELAAASAGAGLGFLDAPVTGSRSHAAAGELTFLVGGDAAVLERARPVLAAMSKAIVHLGPVGSGALIKLINNFVCGVQLASLAEALALIERSGLERDAALRVLADGAPGSPLFKAVSARMTARDYTPNFFLRLMAKDLTYAVAAGAEKSLELATAQTALAAFQRAIAAGHGDKDIAAVVEPLRRG